MSLTATALTLAAFWRAKARLRRLRTAGDVRAWQAARLRRFLLRSAPRVDAFRPLAGHPLTEFPEMDKAALMSAFHRYNVASITAEDARQSLNGTGRRGRYSIGASTGTSGNRGLYIVSDPERFLWLGTLLARALPDMLSQRYRVAVMLPRSSRLYDAANESQRLALKFFDLSDGLEALAGQVEAFAPNVIVAPPHALVALARTGYPASLTHVFSGAEVLDPADRQEIETHFGLLVREIYMATEGLFAVACPLGTLHLCEDCTFFEWEASGDLVTPLITDFTRRSQIMIRYRMNDLLRLSHAPCPCGSPLQAVAEVAGRCDDAFHLRRPGASPVLVTPDIIRNAVVHAAGSISDFRVIQTATDHVVLRLPPAQESELVAARSALQALFRRLGADPQITAQTSALEAPRGGKLRRVIREPGANAE